MKKLINKAQNGINLDLSTMSNRDVRRELKKNRPNLSWSLRRASAKALRLGYNDGIFGTDGRLKSETPVVEEKPLLVNKPTIVKPVETNSDPVYYAKSQLNPVQNSTILEMGQRFLNQGNDIIAKEAELRRQQEIARLQRYAGYDKTASDFWNGISDRQRTALTNSYGSFVDASGKINRTAISNWLKRNGLQSDGLFGEKSLKYANDWAGTSVKFNQARLLPVVSTEDSSNDESEHEKKNEFYEYVYNHIDDPMAKAVMNNTGWENRLWTASLDDKYNISLEPTANLIYFFNHYFEPASGTGYTYRTNKETPEWFEFDRGAGKGVYRINTKTGAVEHGSNAFGKNYRWSPVENYDTSNARYLSAIRRFNIKTQKSGGKLISRK